MKVLWLCNIMLPAIAEALGLPFSNREGWLTGIYERLCKENSDAENGIAENIRIELGVCFPMTEIPAEVAQRCKENGGFRLEATGTLCYPFVENLAAPELYDAAMERRFKEILEEFKPDMVHIFGTEFPHTVAMTRAYGRPERTLIGIQGLCYACADAYMADLPQRVIRRRTFRDVIRKDSIRQQQEKFRVRGEREKEALRRTGHITGRTEFDRRETAAVNEAAKYHFMNETMRAPFYSGEWKEKECEPYRIFLSQGDYPLKGFHYVLQAMPEILKEYPQACVYVAGNSVIDNQTMKDKLKLSSYGKYLRELIHTLGLEKHVKILGRRTAEEMKAEFLGSSVFVCPSSLENSPNSMGEAMLLGVPVVAAAAGGIPSMLTDGKEGLLYEPGNVKQLAECIIKVWKEPEQTAERAKAARDRAWKTHDGNANYERLLAIYREICL